MESGRVIRDLQALGEHQGSDHTDEIDDDEFWRGFQEGFSQGTPVGLAKAREVFEEHTHLASNDIKIENGCLLFQGKTGT